VHTPTLAILISRVGEKSLLSGAILTIYDQEDNMIISKKNKLIDVHTPTLAILISRAGEKSLLSGAILTIYDQEDNMIISKKQANRCAYTYLSNTYFKSGRLAATPNPSPSYPDVEEQRLVPPWWVVKASRPGCLGCSPPPVVVCCVLNGLR
jgi:hypothetical protein